MTSSQRYWYTWSESNKGAEIISAFMYLICTFFFLRFFTKLKLQAFQAAVWGWIQLYLGGGDKQKLVRHYLENKVGTQKLEVLSEKQTKSKKTESVALVESACLARGRPWVQVPVLPKKSCHLVFKLYLRIVLFGKYQTEHKFII
jgi:hypothetical protein